MLPSLGFNEILVLGVIALLVFGPKDLPLMLRKLGQWTAKLRGMAQEFRTGFDELARQAELDELKREVESLRKTTNLNSLANEVTKPLATLEDYAGINKPLPPAQPVPVKPAPVTDVETAAPVEAPVPEIDAEQLADLHNITDDELEPSPVRSAP
jgi:sec-independent protein translocase protein TatB